jgi:hypothetical protein
MRSLLLVAILFTFSAPIKAAHGASGYKFLYCVSADDTGTQYMVDLIQGSLVVDKKSIGFIDTNPPSAPIPVNVEFRADLQTQNGHFDTFNLTRNGRLLLSAVFPVGTVASQATNIPGIDNMGQGFTNEGEVLKCTLTDTADWL